MRDAEAIRGAFEAEYARNIDRILTQIKGPCLMGEDITIPDIVLTHCGGWAFVAKFPTDNAEFKNYLKTMRARPAYQRASALAQS
jgi:glutathione S-transferase